MKVSLSFAVLTAIGFATCLARAAEPLRDFTVVGMQFKDLPTFWRANLSLALVLLAVCGLCFFLGVLAGLLIKGKRSEREIDELRWVVEQTQQELQQLQQQLDVALQQRDQAASQSQRSLTLLREFEHHLSGYLTALDRQGLKLSLDEHGNLQETNNEGFI